MPNYSAHILLSITNRHLGLRSSGVGVLVPFLRARVRFLCACLSSSWCLTCSLDLQNVQWAVGTSRGARKLARTLHTNQKKKKVLPIESKTKEACKK
jgi:hypothetical protein